MPTGKILTGTGFAPPPDIGALSYNGITFSCLFKSPVQFNSIKDNANRTVKWVEWNIEADGYVTGGTPGGTNEGTIDSIMSGMIRKLEQDGGVLYYTGKGVGPIVVNQTGGELFDLNWGPKAKVIEFQPLGGSGAAFVRWTCTTYLPLFTTQQISTLTTTPGIKPLRGGIVPVVQFNYEHSISYDEEGYSHLTLKGTLEIPMTRSRVSDRSIPQTVDYYRELFIEQVASAIDLTRFRFTRREFNVSRDQRLMEWSLVAEEMPRMGMPQGCTNARGTMSVRPEQSQGGFASWICSLRCTYTIRNEGASRAAAWDAFVSMLRFRMEQSVNGYVVKDDDPSAAAQNPSIRPGLLSRLVLWTQVGAIAGGLTDRVRLGLQNQKNKLPGLPALEKALLIHFGFDEGLYLDARTITFEANWRLFTAISMILAASGVWKYDQNMTGGNAWKASIQDIMGWRSWLPNCIDPREDVIVDLGYPG